MNDYDKDKVAPRYSFFPETPDWDAILDSQTLAPDGGHIVVGNISSYRKEVNSDIRKRLTEHDELVKDRERLEFYELAIKTKDDLSHLNFGYFIQEAVNVGTVKEIGWYYQTTCNYLDSPTLIGPFDTLGDAIDDAMNKYGDVISDE